MGCWGRLLSWVALALVLVACGEPELVVPDVVGESVDYATGVLEGAGFTVAVEEGDPAGDVDAVGAVYLQTPPGDHVLLGDGPHTVRLKVYTRPRLVMPLVTNLTEPDAVAKLTAAGIEFRVKTQPSSRVDEGRVAWTDPGGGIELEDGQVVTLNVSSGPPLRSATWRYEIWNDEWWAGDTGGCYTDHVGDSETVTVVGPDGDVLASTRSEPGVVDESYMSDPAAPEVVCAFTLTFEGLPEVASYQLQIQGYWANHSMPTYHLQGMSWDALDPNMMVLGY